MKTAVAGNQAKLPTLTGLSALSHIFRALANYFIRAASGQIFAPTQGLQGTTDPSPGSPLTARSRAGTLPSGDEAYLPLAAGFAGLAGAAAGFAGAAAAFAGAVAFAL